MIAIKVLKCKFQEKCTLLKKIYPHCSKREHTMREQNQEIFLMKITPCPGRIVHGYEVFANLQVYKQKYVWFYKMF